MSELHEPEVAIETHAEWALRRRRERMVASPFQARAALQEAGLLPQVETMMAAPEADPIAKLAWETASEFRRFSPTVQQVAAQLGLTDEDLDALFEQAMTYEA